MLNGHHLRLCEYFYGKYIKCDFCNKSTYLIDKNKLQKRNKWIYENVGMYLWKHAHDNNSQYEESDIGKIKSFCEKHNIKYKEEERYIPCIPNKDILIKEFPIQFENEICEQACKELNWNDEDMYSEINCDCRNKHIIRDFW